MSTWTCYTVLCLLVVDSSGDNCSWLGDWVLLLLCLEPDCSCRTLRPERRWNNGWKVQSRGKRYKGLKNYSMESTLWCSSLVNWKLCKCCIRLFEFQIIQPLSGPVGANHSVQNMFHFPFFRINAIKEITARCPLAMTEDLLQDLVQYKTHKNKSKSIPWIWLLDHFFSSVICFSIVVAFIIIMLFFCMNWEV